MKTLAQQTCIPCTGGVPALEPAQADLLLKQLPEGWRLVDNHHLEKAFTFSDFRGALDFTVRVGDLAEQQGHHPDIHLAWGRVRLEIWTHKVNGLTQSDFVLAAKADALL